MKGIKKVVKAAPVKEEKKSIVLKGVFFKEAKNTFRYAITPEKAVFANTLYISKDLIGETPPEEIEIIIK
jgi:hypothetical protein